MPMLVSIFQEIVRWRLPAMSSSCGCVIGSTQEDKETLNFKFSGRISCGHSGPLCPDAQVCKSFYPSPGSQETQVSGADAHGCWLGRASPEGFSKTLPQKSWPEFSALSTLFASHSALEHGVVHFPCSAFCLALLVFVPLLHLASQRLQGASSHIFLIEYLIRFAVIPENKRYMHMPPWIAQAS